MDSLLWVLIGMVAWVMFAIERLQKSQGSIFIMIRQLDDRLAGNDPDDDGS